MPTVVYSKSSVKYIFLLFLVMKQCIIPVNENLCMKHERMIGLSRSEGKISSIECSGQRVTKRDEGQLEQGYWEGIPIPPQERSRYCVRNTYLQSGTIATMQEIPTNSQELLRLRKEYLPTVGND